MTHLEIMSLSASYDGSASVLDDVNLSIEKGEIVSIIGPIGIGQEHAAARSRWSVAAERRHGCAGRP